MLPVDADGRAGEPTVHAFAGTTPYGFDFAPGGALVVTEAFGGEVGAAASSSYRLDDVALVPVSASVRNTRSEVCWAVTSADGRHVWMTSFGDGTISLYALRADGSRELLDPVAAATVEGSKGIRDAEHGRLESLGAADGLPETVAGLAAR